MMEREELLLYVLKTLRSVDEVVELGVADGGHALLIYKILNPLVSKITNRRNYSWS